MILPNSQQPPDLLQKAPVHRVPGPNPGWGQRVTVTARAQTQRTPGIPRPVFIPNISIKQSHPRVCSAVVAVTKSMRGREMERGSPWGMEAPVSAQCKPQSSQSPSKSTWSWAFSAAWKGEGSHHTPAFSAGIHLLWPPICTKTVQIQQL